MNKGNCSVWPTTATCTFAAASIGSGTPVKETVVYELEYGMGNRLTRTRFPENTLDDVEITYWNSGVLHQHIESEDRRKLYG